MAEFLSFVLQWIGSLTVGYWVGIGAVSVRRRLTAPKYESCGDYIHTVTAVAEEEKIQRIRALCAKEGQ